MILGSLITVGMAVGIGVGVMVVRRRGDFRTRETIKLATNRIIIARVSIKRRIRRRSFLITGLGVTSRGLLRGWSIFW